MKIIPIIGLLYLIKIIFYKKSLIALAVFINGIIYHSYDDKYDKNIITKILRLYDVSSNFIFLLYIFYNNPSLVIYAFLGMFNYMLIKYIEYNEIYGKYVTSEYIDFIHVLCVQLPLFFGLELSYN